MNVLGGNERDCVSQAGVNVFGLQIGIELADDPIEGDPLVN